MGGDWWGEVWFLRLFDTVDFWYSEDSRRILGWHASTEIECFIYVVQRFCGEGGGGWMGWYIRDLGRRKS